MKFENSKFKKISVIFFVFLMLVTIHACSYQRDLNLLSYGLNEPDMIIKITQINTQSIRVYGSTNERYANVSGEAFKEITVAEKDMLINYLRGLHYKWRFPQDKISYSSPEDDVYDIKIFFWDKNDGCLTWMNYSISRNFSINHVSTPEVSRYIEVPLELLAYLESLFANG